MYLLAQSGSTDPLPIVGYGALGAIVMAAFFGLIWFRPAVDNLIKRAEKAEEQRDELIAAMTKEVMPALIANTAANQALKPVLEDVVFLLTEISEESRPKTPAPRARRS